MQRCLPKIKIVGNFVLSDSHEIELPKTKNNPELSIDDQTLRDQKCAVKRDTDNRDSTKRKRSKVTRPKVTNPSQRHGIKFI